MRECGDWIDGYLKLTENTEPPEIFHTWVAISGIAACLQRKCVLPWGRLNFYPNFYIVLISPPGRARKGTAMDPIMEFMEEPRLGIKLAAEAVTREQLIRELKNAGDTVTTLDGKLLNHCSLTICNSELTVFLGYRNLQLLSDLTDWYDCKRHWTYRTKNSGTDIINGVWVNILGATTPALIRSSLPLDAIGGGLTSRIVFIYAGKKRRTIPDPFVTIQEQELGVKLLNDLERIVIMQGNFRPDKSFIEAWTEWYLLNDGNPPFTDEIFAGYCERRPALVMKLSMIMSTSRSDSLIITGNDLLRGVAILEEAEQTMPLALSGVGQGAHADVMSKLMQEIILRKEVTIDTLMWKFRNDVDKWSLDKMIQSMEAMGFCTYISNTHKLLINENFDKR